MAEVGAQWDDRLAALERQLARGRSVVRLGGADRLRLHPAPRVHLGAPLLAVLLGVAGPCRSARTESTMPIVKATAITARLASGPTFTRSSASSFTPTRPSTIAIVSSR